MCLCFCFVGRHGWRFCFVCSACVVFRSSYYSYVDGFVYVELVLLGFVVFAILLGIYLVCCVFSIP